MGSLLLSFPPPLPPPLSFPVRCTCSHTGPLRVTCNGFLFNIYSGCRCRCCCAAVLHFKINIWILISKKFTLGYGSSVRCLLNPGSRQAPSRGAVTEGGRGGREALCLHLLAASLVGNCMCTPQSVSLSLGVRVCVYLISVHMHSHINSHTRVRARGGEKGKWGAPSNMQHLLSYKFNFRRRIRNAIFSLWKILCFPPFPLIAPLLCLFMLGFLPFALPVFEIVIGQCISLFRLPANELLTLSKDSS